MARPLRRGSPSGPESTTKITGVAFTLGTINTNTGKVLTAAVAGAQTTDMVVLNPTANLVTGVGLANAWISAAGVVSVAFINATAAAVAGGTVTCNATLLRYRT
jgi:hypothetical protein